MEGLTVTKGKGGKSSCDGALFLFGLANTSVNQIDNGQSGRKCVIVESVLRAKQGPCEPIKGCIREIREQ